MSEIAVDTSVWITYFRGRNTDIVRRIDTSNVTSSALALAEIHDVLGRHGVDPGKHIEFVRTHGEIVSVDARMALAGSRIKQEQRSRHPRFGIIDAIHYATARRLGIPFLTHDKEFSGLDGVEIV